MKEIAFGGGCHWCTEAVFQSLKGVHSVAQGFIASIGEEISFSEAVIVQYNPKIISLKILIEIHLLTHKSTSDHSMRNKYRSGVYTFSQDQMKEVQEILNSFQKDFKDKIITRAYPFSAFKPSREALRNYYFSNPQKPFCQKFIDPKLDLLLKNFGDYLKSNLK